MRWSRRTLDARVEPFCATYVNASAATHTTLAWICCPPIGSFPLAFGEHHLSAFRVGRQTYRYRVTRSRHVQRALSQIIWVYLSQGVWFYINNVVIATDTEKKLVWLLGGVVVAIDKNCIRCKLSKTIIKAWSIGHLGHILLARNENRGQQARGARLPTRSS
jgi:hypothetical protein